MSDFGDMGGVLSDRGFTYQKYYAIYCLVVDEAREIEYECDGQDISVINEDRSKNSITYIQCKYHTSGQVTVSNFVSEVFDGLWNSYSKLYDRYAGKKQFNCKLVTNISVSKDFKTFLKECYFLRTMGHTLKQFEGNIEGKRNINKPYQKMKKGKNIDKFYRFLWGLSVDDLISQDYLKANILLHFNECGVREPRTQLKNVFSLITENGQGIITRRQIEECIGFKLEKISNSTINTIPEKEKKETINDFYELHETLSDDEMPDKVKILTGITYPTKKMSGLISFTIQSNTDISTDDAEMYTEIIEERVQSINADADELSRLNYSAWEKKKSITKNMDALMEVYDEFNMDDGE